MRTAMESSHFPTILYEMMAAIDDGVVDGGAISWQKHGKCFLIRDKEEFSNKILPRYVLD